MSLRRAVLVLSFPLMALRVEAAEFTRSGTFCPIKTTYEQLSEVLDPLRVLRIEANRDHSERAGLEWLEVRANAHAYRLHKGFSVKELSGAPAVADDLHYYYQSQEAPITRISVRLSHRERKLEVSGENREQVDAIFATGYERFSALGCTVGGPAAQFILFISLMVFGIVIGSSVAVARTKLQSRAFLTIGAVSVLSAFSLLLSDILPGFQIYLGEPSFLERNSAIISFLGLAATVVTFAIGLLYTRHLTRATRSSSSEQ